jgi:hypothetical protein
MIEKRSLGEEHQTIIGIVALLNQCIIDLNHKTEIDYRNLNLSLNPYETCPCVRVLKEQLALLVCANVDFLTLAKCANDAANELDAIASSIQNSITPDNY